ncbi:XRE family transcriptional regulator [Rickettsiales endosymbiont of Paramecium tredecaurelia]|uniref:helix-turn-helix domain-containing protein n=1 Tax=Candidatus Sarmatiella mevalonica TaxID=2770581 RepID=UPI001922D84F|nr:helix-turn-helix transcriptional regulator [Candidatus Sarmatiella mevalonica]MBL3284557.1 XRE family transcriptional regulator [Candidatus Sarmatiella mevalonica]
MARKNDEMTNIDLVVGRIISTLRLQCGFSRKELADLIGVTHQQLQKYEKGTNRVSFSRLLLICKALGVTLSYFYENIESASSTEVNERQRLCLEVIRNFMKINPAHQQAVNVLIRSLTQQNHIPEEYEALAECS